jgi:uncharacterized protein (AIM24 family)
MPDAIPRGPFDEGLFLAHFNKGRELFDAGHHEAAERELEEAYLLRPRDVRVLNLLGLVYFRQEKLERAEEVYRKLIAESPDAHTLHYNLGLICLKLNRLDHAESAFLKALELTPANPKIHFYLGSIYERQHRFKDAIFQYRQAGANMMVRRVEGKLGAPAPPSPPPLPVRAPRPDTKPPALGPSLLESEEAGIVTAKVVVPVSSSILSEPSRSATTGTGRFAPFDDDTVPPPARSGSETAAGFAAEPSASESPRPPAPELPPSDDHPTDQTNPPMRSPFATARLAASTADRPPSPATPPDGTSIREVFRCVEKGLMEVDFSGKVFIKQGTIYSYSGNLTFWVKEKRPGGLPALVIVTGTGRLLLTDHERDITLMQVGGEAVYVEPGHLLACEEGLQPRYERIGPTDDTVDVVVLEGRGRVALSVASKPLPLTVRPGLPVSIPSRSVIMWTGRLEPTVVEDPTVYEVVLPSQPGGGRLLRLEGEGRVLVEQATG